MSYSSAVSNFKQRIILNTVKKGKQNLQKNRQNSIHSYSHKNKPIKIQQNIHHVKNITIKHQSATDSFQLPCATFQFQKNVHDDEFSHDLTNNINSTILPKWSIGDFEILQQLGHGKFGQVYAARDLKTDFIIALKKMSRTQLTENNFEKQIKRQIIIQSSLKHQNILKLFGYFWDEQSIYLILQYAPAGQLYGLLKKCKRFKQNTVSVIIRQVLEALKYLHKNSIIHRDIKPENLLVSLGNIKLADFGWSIHSDKRRDTLCGTLDYLAPEMVKGSTHDSSIDIWEVGVLAFQLAVGYPPFQTNSYNETYDKIINSDVIFPQTISFELRKFIRRCLQKRPQKRPKVDDCLNEDFILNYLDQQLQFDD